MERVLTQEERIRRAEEIYMRRRNTVPQYRETRETVNNRKEPIGKNLRLFKRMALQIVVCLLLYCIFYLIYDTNYSFSDATISKTQDILNYDINFEEIYKYINGNIMVIINKNIDKEENNNNNIEENNDNVANNNEEKNSEQTNHNDIPSNEIPENIVKQEEVPKQVEQTSATEFDLKSMYSLVIPVNGGHVSSEFGVRESTSEVVSTNHKGIDIAVAERY